MLEPIHRGESRLGMKPSSEMRGSAVGIGISAGRAGIGSPSKLPAPYQLPLSPGATFKAER